MNNVDTYLNSLAPKDKAVLSVLRKQILNIVPNAEERLSRGVPFFYYRNKRAVGFRASKNHLSFFIMEGKVMKDFRKEVAEFENSSTVLRFTANNPLPEKLIGKLVFARIAEIEQMLSKKK